MPSPPPRPRFSSCWQDPAPVIAAAAALHTRELCLVGGTGDLALDLAAAGLQVGVAPLDADDAALTELKCAAVRHLPAQSVCSFLGLAHFGRRVWFYHHLRAHLSPSTRVWGDAREAWIRLGLLDAGRFETGVARMRRALGTRAPHGPRWTALLHLLGSAPGRRLLGLGSGSGPGGPASWVAARRLTGSPWCERLAGGGWQEPGLAHPWMAAEGLGAARAALPTRLPDDAPLTGLVVVPEAAEHLDDRAWEALLARCAPGSVVLIFERWRARTWDGATPVPLPEVLDRSPLSAGVRAWRLPG